LNGPVASLIGDGSRLHLQHGPIDLVIGAESTRVGERRRAFEAAAARFDTVLSEIVAELHLLRSQDLAGSETPVGKIARRMDAATRPHAKNVFVTPMAAVAGAVADEILGAMVNATKLTRAYVNNGGDIALHLDPGYSYSAAIAGLDHANLGKIELPFEAGISGIATSGQGGRSLSLGIAESVTVLSTSAASADVAATLIANAVDLPRHPQVKRQAANLLQPDSDLGEREVVVFVGRLNENEIANALDTGVKVANRMLNDRQINAASLTLCGHQQLVGTIPVLLSDKLKEVENV
jgi:ApbE superfamily uncharacterized protein (UPF0280 family)